MIRRTLSAITLLLGLSSPAFAFQECKFNFEIDTQSSAFQARIRDAQETGGLWRPIREAPDDVRAISHYIGRLDICLVTPDGKPREISINGQTTTLQSPHVASCTAALLPNNRLLTNRHCFYEDTLAAAGFSIVQEARINFDYVAKDFTDNVKTFLVLNREVALDEKLDAMVLQIIGGDANEALGGHIPLVMETRATPRRKMTMVHHPRGLPQQYSDYTCQIHPDQNMLPEAASQLRHRCESAGGSSGSLLLDARSLAVVGLHNQGGMGPQGGYNGGHKIEMINAALGLGFEPVVGPTAEEDLLAAANAALVAALMEQDPRKRRTALEQVTKDHTGTPIAEIANTTLALMKPAEPVPPITPKVTNTAPAPIRVSAGGNGDYLTVAEAVEAAAPGSIIEIYPGHYMGGIKLDKPLELIGVGDRSTIILEAVDDFGIHWTTRAGKVNNLTIKQSGENFASVFFEGGSGLIQNCELTSEGFATVALIDGADPTIKSNSIGNAVGYGIMIEGKDNEGGLIIGNEIFASGKQNIVVSFESSIEIRDNIIRDSKNDGIAIFLSATPKIEGNRISGNLGHGVSILASGDPILKNNLVKNNLGYGIYVFNEAAGRVVENDIRNNNFGEILNKGDDNTTIFIRNILD